MTGFDLRSVDLGKLDSATRYPSIPTYHGLGERGVLVEADPVAFTGPVVFTEKVDGTNGRIVVLPGGGYLIGSREELLYARGDLIRNPANGVVPTLEPVAERLVGELAGATTKYMARVFFFEVYGGRNGSAAQQYTTNPRMYGFRLFDVAFLNLEETLGFSVEQIASWRDRGGQHFAHEPLLKSMAGDLGLPLVPRIEALLSTGDELPTGIETMYAVLTSSIARSQVVLDESGKGRAEGLVLRAWERQRGIAKVRFRDYERTLRLRGQQRTAG